MDFIRNNVFSIITAIVAIIAIWQTHLQIRISNKQFLFKERIDSYVIFKGLFDLYEENKNSFDYHKYKKKEPLMVDYLFENLTNNSLLYEHTILIINLKNNNLKKEFLLKLERIQGLSYRIKYLFKGKNGRMISDFIYSYQEVLFEIYKYELINDMIRNDSVPRKENWNYEDISKSYGEKAHRDRLFKSYEKINAIYKNIISNKVIDSIEKTISL